MTTSTEYLNALQKARAKGDMDAVAYFRQKAAETARDEDRERYRPDAPRGAQGVLANVGAGLHTLGQGAGQVLSEFTPMGQAAKLAGLQLGPSGEDVAESSRIKRQLGRDTMGGYGGALQFAVEAAPGFALPMTRAASLANAARSGAAAGGVGALLQPTENPNVAQGKMEQAALGGTLGGALGGAIHGAPTLASAVRQRFSPSAEEMMAQALRQGGQTPGQAAAAIAAQRAQPTLGGAQLPTAAATENRGLMELEKALSGNITSSRSTLAGAETAANAQRTRALEQALGDPVDALHAKGLADNFFRTELASTPVQPFAAQRLDNLLQRTAAEQGDPAVAREISRIRAGLGHAVTTANNTQSWRPLYEFRQGGLDDLVADLARNTSSSFANRIRTIINDTIRPEFDDVLLQASGGRSSQLVGRGSRGHQLLTDAEQMAAAQELRRAIEVGTPTSGGDPSLITQSVQRRLQQLEQEPRTVYGSDVLNPQARQAVQQMTREAALLRRSKAPDITGNVPATTRQAMQGVENPRTGWYMSGAGAAAALVHPVVGAAVILTRLGLNRSREAAMRELTEVMADAGRARNLLLEMERRGATAQEIGIVREVLQRGAGGAAGAAQ